jgi:Uncharacterized protein family UPF0016
MARTSEGTGETFGIGFLHPGSGGGSRAKVVLPPDPRRLCMEAFLVSTLVVGLAEIGDKTQILSLILAARFQRPVPIIFGILFATLANHAAAGLAGMLFGSLLSGDWMRWVLGISFLGVAIWALFPDKYEGRAERVSRLGAFAATLVAFFLAEIGDKTQICHGRTGRAVRAVLSGRDRHHARHDAGQYPGCRDRRPHRRPVARQGYPARRGGCVRGVGDIDDDRDRGMTPAGARHVVRSRRAARRRRWRCPRDSQCRSGRPARRPGRGAANRAC